MQSAQFARRGGQELASFENLQHSLRVTHSGFADGG
jgi:hypothetical protein